MFYQSRNLLIDSKDRGAKALLIIQPCGDVMRLEDWIFSFWWCGWFGT